jgi:hypothetical protein
MSVARHHAEWLSLVETSGPFLSMPVLMRVFPQGLERRNPAKASLLREAYEDWLERGEKQSAVHHAWIRHVLTELLEYPPEFLAEGQAIPPGMEAVMVTYGETLRPNFVLKHRDAATKPLLLIQHYAAEQDLEKPVAGKTWKASPVTRMMGLLHGADVPLGLVTNGEQWTLVYAPRGETTGFASWYADLWMQEPITLRAFHSLLHLRRFLGVAEPETLAALYEQSAKDQQEVTEQLGYQVRRAVEMLVQAFAAIEADQEGRALLSGVGETELYNAALTLMMRLVFLFCAEERKLLLLGDPLYDQHYAVSTLSEILRERADQYGEEVLERRHDAWCRLLATFRAIHSGVEHESMRLPPYGGRLFDPDAYPFLEGRPANTHWSTTPSKPLPINNRVVLHLLEALQFLRVKVPGGGPTEARRLSFRALSVEQIGHVYEGLLDHTAKRANEVVLGLAGSRDAEPETPLSTLEGLAEKGTDALVEFLKKETGRSATTLSRLVEQVPTLDEHALLIACGQDSRLVPRMKPFAGLIREDDFGRLVIIQPGSIYVTRGSDRRSTGTHYTPPSLTEPIVQYTLEPLVYIGPAEAKPKEEWKLKSPREILAFKVCDMTMGSGAFLVQSCRYLAERLVEAWELAEKANPGKILATPEGDFSEGDPKERIIPTDAAERVAIARRYVADRCLYGVDINPMAVEMAKLSLWLITLQRDRPFTFLDHALKCGDSLLGVSALSQIENFSLRPGKWQVTFGTANLFRYVEEASKKRRELEDLPSNNYADIEAKNRLHAEAEAATAKVKAIADWLIAFELRGLNGDAYEQQRTREADEVELSMKHDADAGIETTHSKSELARAAHHSLRGRRPFHWSVEFPEVFARGGFDAMVGNPPFQGGYLIGLSLGNDYRKYLGTQIAAGVKGSADLCAFFFLRSTQLIGQSSLAGLVATNTIAQGDTRDVGLAQMLKHGIKIIQAVSSKRWPGTASLEVAFVWYSRREWKGVVILDGREVKEITPRLSEVGEVSGNPYRLAFNIGKAFKGTTTGCVGFVLEKPEVESLLQRNPKNIEVIKPFLGGDEFNSNPDQAATRYVIDFQDWDFERAEEYPECLQILTERVKPYRDKLTGQIHEHDYWKFSDKRLESYKTIKDLKRVLFHSFTSKYLCFGFVPTGIIYSAPHVVVGLDDDRDFAILQSSLHGLWAFAHCSTMKTDLRYAPSDLFDTFAFPIEGAEAKLILRNFGRCYHALRSEITITRQEGLTDTYNRFHKKGEQSEDIARLRALRVEMDQAVAAAYGWSDLDLGHGFHATKQGERYTLSESARRKVLDRLLRLNHERYEEEVRLGLHDKKRGKTKKRVKSAAAAAEDDNGAQAKLQLF